MARFSDWDFFNKNVQSGLTEGQFINSASTLLCAGPPYLAASGSTTEAQASSGEVVYPIGLTNGWGVSQQMAVVPVVETGSYRSYTVTGPTQGSLQLGRTLYHGPSLLRTMYAYYKALAPGGVPVYPMIDNEAANIARNPHNYISDSPGYENAYFNLASDIFTQPIGLMIFIQDINRESYGAIYLEQVHIGNHEIQSGPSSVVIQEQIGATFTRAKPVKLSNPIPLMSRFQDSGIITTAGSMTGGVTRLVAETQSNR